MRIAVPNSPYCQPLLANAERICEERGWTLTVTTEVECGRLLLNNFVEMALVSPLEYGRAVGRVDYRIVAGPCVVMQDFTNMVGINIAEGKDEIQTIGSSQPAWFMSAIAAIVMREKFEMSPTPVVTLPIDGSTLDCIVEFTSADQPAMLDVSEEWFDMTDKLLPVAVWACRAEAAEEITTVPLAEIVQAMADPEVATITITEDLMEHSDLFPREGIISYHWSADIIPALNEVLETLFYHQFVPEIPAIKILGIHD